MPNNVEGRAFMRFMQGFAAWTARAKHASDMANWLEALVLYVGLIDAMLRVGIVLKRQLQTNSKTIDLKLIYQDEETGYYSERKVIQMSLDEGVIDQAFFDELNVAYNRRNKGVHRLFLSQVTYRDLRGLAQHYEGMIRTCDRFIDKLEQDQIDTGRGMTTEGNKKDDSEFFRDALKRRLGPPDHLAKLLIVDSSFILKETCGWPVRANDRQVQLAAPNGAITISTWRSSNPGDERDAIKESETFARIILGYVKGSEPDSKTLAPFPKPLDVLPDGLRIEGNKDRAWMQFEPEEEEVTWLTMVLANGPRVLHASYNGKPESENTQTARRIMESIDW